MKNKEKKIRVMKKIIQMILAENSLEYSKKLVDQLCVLNQPIVVSNTFNNPLVMELFSFNRHQYLLEIRLIKDPEKKAEDIAKTW